MDPNEETRKVLRVPLLSSLASQFSSPRWPGRIPGFASILKVALPVTVLLISYTVTTGMVQASGASAQCSPQQISNDTLALSAPLTANQVGSYANSSSVYNATIASLGTSVNVSYLGVFQLSQIDASACTVQLQSLNAAYEVFTPSGSGQLTITENPTTGEVVNATVQASPGGAVAHSSTQQWSGWTVVSCGSSCNIRGTYAEWQNFGVSVPSNECGASRTLVGACQIAFWSGLTATFNGANNAQGTGQGIAQSGVNAGIICEWVIFGYDCGATYTGWYEFYPQDPTAITCFSFGSASNQLVSEISWQAPNTYFAQIDDLTTGQDCSPYGQTTMAMGAPAFGQFQSESDSNGIGGAYDIPNFNFWFNPAAAVGDPANIVGNTDSWLGVPGVTVGSAYFNQNACLGTGESCFEESA
jgi:hypothetical protein